MTPAFVSAIQNAYEIARSRNIIWDMRVRDDGRIEDADVWNLTVMAGAVSPSSHYLNSFGPDAKSLLALSNKSGSPVLSCPLSQHWQDLIKSAAIDQIFVRRNTPGHVAIQVIRPLKIVAMCAGEAQPWQLNAEHVRCAIDVAEKVQPTGKLRDVVVGVVKVIIDGWHISECGPLYPILGLARLKGNSQRARFARREEELLNDLEGRKRAERLPERRAFWELARIVFCEKPQSFTDEIRFAAIKVMLLCGLRIGEIVMLPADWRRDRHHNDRYGAPAGDSGGFSKSLYLRHFAEKQQSEDLNSQVLYPATQPIPKSFEEILASTLERVGELTRPLRETLHKQVESGRLLPWFDEDELVPLVRLYPYMTGQPFWLKIPRETQDYFIGKYSAGHESAVLQELGAYQDSRYWNSSGVLDGTAYVQLSRLKRGIEEGEINLPLYTMNGARYDGFDIKKTPWQQIGVRISDFEKYLADKAPTKRPDVAPYRLGSGEYVQTWELLFLIPKRALSEARNDGICDVTRHYAVGVMGTDTIRHALTSSNPDSLFARYGESDEDRAASLNPHSLRHLQNSELFRMGIADAVISKRFNRKSVAQSYEYDHRSLTEQLDEIELPAETELALGPKSSTVFKMIQSGKASGPIVENFKRVQAAEGDAAAFQYLRTEADGFHATPYGHCLNSFTVDPCPKHLECFAGCRHLSATDLPDTRSNLLRLEGKLQETVNAIRERRASGVGLANQLAHAEVRLKGVQQLLATAPGDQVFPDGPDLSIPPSSTVQDIE